jgi:hypothetical protein
MHVDARECPMMIGFFRGLRHGLSLFFFTTQTDDLLRDKAHKVLDGDFAATGLPEPPSLDREYREWCATSIYTIISARFRYKLRTTPGQLTERAVHAKKVKEHVS